MSGCSYPPTDLKGALEANEWTRRNQDRNSWNELVIDLRSVVARLPAIVEGFFCPAGATSAERDKTRRWRSSFLEEYGMPSDSAEVVLAEMDLSAAHSGIIFAEMSEM